MQPRRSDMSDASPQGQAVFYMTLASLHNIRGFEEPVLISLQDQRR